MTPTQAKERMNQMELMYDNLMVSNHVQEYKRLKRIAYPRTNNSYKSKLTLLEYDLISARHKIKVIISEYRRYNWPPYLLVEDLPEAWKEYRKASKDYMHALNNSKNNQRKRMKQS